MLIRRCLGCSFSVDSKSTSNIHTASIAALVIKSDEIDVKKASTDSADMLSKQAFFKILYTVDDNWAAFASAS